MTLTISDLMAIDYWIEHNRSLEFMSRKLNIGTVTLFDLMPEDLKRKYLKRKKI